MSVPAILSTLANEVLNSTARGMPDDTEQKLRRGLVLGTSRAARLQGKWNRNSLRFNPAFTRHNGDLSDF